MNVYRLPSVVGASLICNLVGIEFSRLLRSGVVASPTSLFGKTPTLELFRYHGVERGLSLAIPILKHDTTTPGMFYT